MQEINQHGMARMCHLLAMLQLVLAYTRALPTAAFRPEGVAWRLLT
jgi:hypothetical protein